MEGAQHPYDTLVGCARPCRATKWQVVSLIVFEDDSCFLCILYLALLGLLCSVCVPHLPTPKCLMEWPGHHISASVTEPRCFGRAERTECLRIMKV